MSKRYASPGLNIPRLTERLSKTVLISGIGMMAVGQLLRGLTAMGEIIVNSGSAVFMIGLAVLIGGWMMFSRINPPINVRP